MDLSNTQNKIQSLMDFNWQDFAVQQLNNEFMVGMLAFGLLGGLMYNLRVIPSKIYSLLKFQLTVTISVRSEDELFNYINQWLNRTSYIKNRCRRLQSVMIYNHEDGRSEYISVPGEGKHLLFIKGVPVCIERKLDESRVNNERKETMIMTQLGRHPKTLNNIIQESMGRYSKNTKIKVKFYNAKHEYWTGSVKKHPRSFDSVFIPQEQKDRITQDIQWFYDNEKWYIDMGIPHHRGYLFTGPPGTGKTSTIAILASHFKKNISILSIASIDSDDGLFEAINTIPENSILVIEDIDTYAVAKERSTNTKTISDRSATVPCIANDKSPDCDNNGGYAVQSGEGITLSGLLNCLDGVGSRDGLVTIMTTNHPETLDKALMRPGRVDLREDFTLQRKQEREDMFKFFFPEADRSVVVSFGKRSKGKTPAELQQLFIQYRGDPCGVLHHFERALD